MSTYRATLSAFLVLAGPLRCARLILEPHLWFMSKWLVTVLILSLRWAVEIATSSSFKPPKGRLLLKGVADAFLTSCMCQLQNLLLLFVQKRNWGLISKHTLSKCTYRFICMS